MKYIDWFLIRTLFVFELFTIALFIYCVYTDNFVSPVWRGYVFCILLIMVGPFMSWLHFHAMATREEKAILADKSLMAQIRPAMEALKDGTFLNRLVRHKSCESKQGQS